MGQLPSKLATKCVGLIDLRCHIPRWDSCWWRYADPTEALEGTCPDTLPQILWTAIPRFRLFQILFWNTRLTLKKLGFKTGGFHLSIARSVPGEAQVHGGGKGQQAVPPWEKFWECELLLSKLLPDASGDREVDNCYSSKGLRIIKQLLLSLPNVVGFIPVVWCCVFKLPVLDPLIFGGPNSDRAVHSCASSLSSWVRSIEGEVHGSCFSDVRKWGIRIFPQHTIA